MEVIHIAPAGQGEHWQVGTDVITIKASGENTSGRMLILEVLVPPGGGPPMLHRHHYAEVFYILEGVFEINTTDVENKLSTIKIETGDTLAIPSMVWHNFKNVGTTSGKFLAMHSPGGMEAFAREVGTPIEDPRQLLHAGSPPSEEQKQRLMESLLKYMDVLPFDKISKE